MKRAGRTTIWVIISLLLSAGAEAVTPGNSTSQASANQYQGIVDRNVFNLRPPPAPVNPADLIKKQEPPKITLDGITTILGKKETFLSVPATKPGTPAQTLMLAEGQAEDDVEVTSIDEKAGVVKVINHGESETLDFDHNGTKPVATAPGAPGNPVTIPPIPAPAPANTQPSPFPNVIRPIRTLPTRSPGGPFGGVSPSSMSPEDQETMIEAQRYKALQDNDPIAKILPPTPHTQEIINGFNQAPQ